MFSKNSLIIVVLALALASLLWWWGLPGSGPSDSLDSQVVQGPEQELVNNLISLRSVTLSGTIFSDPAFQSLSDVGVEIVDEPSGRRNPFAPLGFSPATSAASSSQNAPRLPARPR